MLWRPTELQSKAGMIQKLGFAVGRGTSLIHTTESIVLFLVNSIAFGL